MSASVESSTIFGWVIVGAFALLFASCSVDALTCKETATFNGTVHYLGYVPPSHDGEKWIVIAEQDQRLERAVATKEQWGHLKIGDPVTLSFHRGIIGYGALSEWRLK